MGMWIVHVVVGGVAKLMNQNKNKDELDSYMYQTVGHDAIQYYAECMGLPLYRRDIQGMPIHQGYEYVATEKDETEDLYTLLQDVLASISSFFRFTRNN